MNDVQLNRLARAQKVSQFLADHETDLTPTPIITATFKTQLDDRIAQVLNDDALATQDNTGNAAEKSETRTLLEESVYHVASGLVSYADDTNDFVMQNTFDFTISQIQGFRDSRLQQFAHTVHAKASDAAIAAVLETDHNVSAADLTELSSTSKDFDEQIGAPLEKRAESVAYGKLVDRDLSAVEETLDKIRRKMSTYRKTNRLLFDMFTEVDKIDDFGHGGKSSDISGSVNAGETKVVASPIYPYNAGANITLQNTGTVPLTFTVYLGGTPQGTGVTVNAGTTLTTTWGALAASGDALMVTNSNGVPGSYKVAL